MIMSESVILLTVAIAVFSIGIFGLITRSNLIKIVISMELLGKAISLVFITGGYLAGNVGLSQAVVFTLIVIEAVIAGVALVLVVLIKRTWMTLDMVVIAHRIRRGEP